MFQELREDGGAQEPGSSNQYARSSRMNNELLPDLNTNKEQLCGGCVKGRPCLRNETPIGGSGCSLLTSDAPLRRDGSIKKKIAEEKVIFPLKKSS